MNIKAKFISTGEKRNWVVLGNYYYEDYGDDTSEEDMNDIKEAAEAFLLQIDNRLKIVWPKSYKTIPVEDNGVYTSFYDIVKKNASTEQRKK